MLDQHECDAGMGRRAFGAAPEARRLVLQRESNAVGCCAIHVVSCARGKDYAGRDASATTSPTRTSAAAGCRPDLQSRMIGRREYREINRLTNRYAICTVSARTAIAAGTDARDGQRRDTSSRYRENIVGNDLCLASHRGIGARSVRYLASSENPQDRFRQELACRTQGAVRRCESVQRYQDGPVGLSVASTRNRPGHHEATLTARSPAVPAPAWRCAEPCHRRCGRGLGCSEHRLRCRPARRRRHCSMNQPWLTTGDWQVGALAGKPAQGNATAAGDRLAKATGRAGDDRDAVPELRGNTPLPITSRPAARRRTSADATGRAGRASRPPSRIRGSSPRPSSRARSA
jgi:hypothetical protein